MKGLTFGALALLLMLTGCAQSAPEPDLTVWVVRHAEKQTGADPALTRAGAARADALAGMLAGEDLRGLHSTDTTRTRQTLDPLVAQTGLEVQLYDAGAPDALIARLRTAGGKHVVVGHSNTVPDLVDAMGGDGGAPIVEATEYDRLYRVEMRGEAVKTAMRRYGDGS